MFGLTRKVVVDGNASPAIPFDVLQWCPAEKVTSALQGLVRLEVEGCLHRGFAGHAGVRSVAISSLRPDVICDADMAIMLLHRPAASVLGVQSSLEEENIVLQLVKHRAFVENDRWIPFEQLNDVPISALNR